MIDLLDREYEALRAVIRAGGDGLPLGQGVTPSQAIRLSLDGLARISPPGAGPQRVSVTARGASAFRMRGRAVA
jgi:hypothetical protein